MQTLTYDHRRAERESWGEGPWVDEPDKVQWQDEATGLPCLVVRNQMGGWCGYVGVTEEHPLFEERAGDPDNFVHPHGGVTFQGFCAPDDKEHGICHVVEPGENDRVWWIGFDCCHGGRDLIPAMGSMWKEVGMEPPRFQSRMFDETYKTLDYVRTETAELAKQLAEVA